ncbi:unnamed protein product [Trichobilharzia szidati]|nr:unnamed protein product [Trichobilharzia szidati]
MVDYNKPTPYIANADGAFIVTPLSATQDGQVVLQPNKLGLSNIGEDTVVVMADDTETLKNMIASGGVTAIVTEDGTEYLQLFDPSVGGAQIIETPDQQTQPWNPVALSQQFDSVNYQCPSCPALLSSVNAFTKHMRQKHSVKLYACHQCGWFFETLSQVFLHARRSHVDPKKPERNPANFKFHCDQCDYKTNNRVTMEHHKRSHAGEKPYVCEVCNKRFTQRTNMITHRNRHIHRDKIFRCEACDKAFSSHDIYLSHLQTREHELREYFEVISSQQLSIECLGCSVTFDSIYNLSKHTRRCWTARTLQTKFRCLPCNVYVNDVLSLRVHIKTHRRSEIISCPLCGEQGFPGFNQLSHHITRTHDLKVNRRHVCRYCEFTFNLKKDLEEHVRNMHTGERNTRQSRGSVGRLKCHCGDCEFTTNSMILLDRHHDKHRRQEAKADLKIPPAHDVTRSTIVLVKSNTWKSQGGDEHTRLGGAIKTNTSSGRISRARRPPEWLRDYHTDFPMHNESTELMEEEEEVQIQLPPGFEFCDLSTVDDSDIPTEEWNIVIYDDDEDDEDDNEEEDRENHLNYEGEDDNAISQCTTNDTTGLLS